MCGIIGYVDFTNTAPKDLSQGLKALHRRGPDFQSQCQIDHVALGHARLSILDTSAAAHQPMTEAAGELTIVFNGEIFNYLELRAQLISQFQETFQTHSDTEVLLKLYKHHGIHFLNRLNGFWAFCIYDRRTKTTFIARDRYGVKPVLYCHTDQYFCFASELKGLITLGIKKDLDYDALFYYFQLNYIPAPQTIFSSVKKLLPGHYALIEKGQVELNSYYTIDQKYLNKSVEIDYPKAQSTLKKLLDESVERRMISDVPLGAFLSGGIDSSIISGIAASKVNQLNTFSIGFKDEPFFDETKYAQLTAKHFKTHHTVFSLSNQDLFEHLHEVLDYIDEPFADSSALAVFILSKFTRKEVTVALSGDGADEIFGGYNKHKASVYARQYAPLKNLFKAGMPILNQLPKSRQSFIGNTFRQAHRFAKGVSLSHAERYWRWCLFDDDTYAARLLDAKLHMHHSKKIKAHYLAHFTESGNFNEELYADMGLVLQNDMLVKVDWMSMANSLEVRTPFLDYTIVDFAFQLPVKYKIEGGITKKILKETYRDFLPPELFHRPKHGFEVPLLKWFRTDLQSMICDDLLSASFIQEQGIFNPNTIEQLKTQLFSTHPGEIHAKIWALIVFQTWWKKYMIQ
jgi:asparagine synthase (glutamine-hydrolysing)